MSCSKNIAIFFTVNTQYVHLYTDMIIIVKYISVRIDLVANLANSCLRGQ